MTLLSFALLSLYAADIPESLSPTVQPSYGLLARATDFWNGFSPVSQTTAVVGFGLAGLVFRSTPCLLNAAIFSANPAAAIASLAFQTATRRMFMGAAFNTAVSAYRYAPFLRQGFDLAYKHGNNYFAGFNQMNRALRGAYRTA